MSITCEIIFENNPMKVVNSGHLLRGRVELNLSKEKIVRAVYIDLCGKAYASWTENNGRYQNTYTGEETYLNERTYFVGERSENIRLPSGNHNYTFECNLPTTLPTSIEGGCGHIRYMSRVVIDIPFWPSKIFTQPFTVIKPIDLNTVPILRKAITYEKTVIFGGANWLCWLYSDPLKMSIRIPVSGYCPGQFINVEINVNNPTGQSIRDIWVKLIRKVTFRCANNNRETTENSTMTKTKVDGCNRYQNKLIRAKVQVPSTPPTDLSSKILRISYVVRVIATTSSYWCSAAVFDIPITIGTNPIQEFAREDIVSIENIRSVVLDNVHLLEPLPLQSIEEDAPPYSATSNTPPPFPNDALPTYEEAIILNHADENRFKQKYPVFKHSTSYSSED